MTAEERNPRAVNVAVMLCAADWTASGVRLIPVVVGPRTTADDNISCLRRRTDAGRKPMIRTRHGARYLLRPIPGTTPDHTASLA